MLSAYIPQTLCAHVNAAAKKGAYKSICEIDLKPTFPHFKVIINTIYF